jgi:hypothetical protein
MEKRIENWEDQNYITSVISFLQFYLEIHCMSTAVAVF